MSILQAIIIGIIQGVTEFLPISSSGHMLIAGRLLDVEVTLAFELVMHLATLLAVLVVMRQDVWLLVKKPLGRDMRLIVVATIPTVIIVFLLKDTVVSTFGGGLLPYCFIITAIMLLCSGFVKKPVKTEIGFLDALIIGSVQGVAAFPGISRSGSTISTGVMLGGEKNNVARFSFLLSIPIIIGSSLVEIVGGGLSSTPVLPLIFGFVFAFLSGYGALKFMLKRFKASFDYFAIYLLALSILMLLNDFVLHWF